MLQKPAPKSKAKDNAKYLLSRLDRWKKGDLNSILVENIIIQNRLQKSLKVKEESKQKGFCRLMMAGKVGQAMKLINNEDSVVGVHSLSEDVKKILEDKHPPGEEASSEILLPNNNPDIQNIIFEEINADIVKTAARNLHGSGGPTLLDSDGWKHILCSKVYGKSSYQLCEAIAELTKLLCIEEIDPDCLTEFIACRLVPLNKGTDKDGKLGVRPIGIGEILRRITGKVVVSVIKNEIQEAAGPLQSCTAVPG